MGVSSTSIVKVKVSATEPQSSARWEVLLTQDHPQRLAYTNLAYAMIAKTLVRLGAAMSAADLGDDTKINDLQRELAD